MSHLRSSILGLIAFGGVAFGGLRSTSGYWSGAFYTMTVGLLLLAVLLARFRRGTGRAFWFGFAVFGWGAFLLTTNPWQTQFDWMAGSVGRNLNDNLLTSRVIKFLVIKTRMETDQFQQIDPITANTVAIIALLVVLAIASLGGLFSVAMKQQARRPKPAD